MKQGTEKVLYSFTPRELYFVKQYLEKFRHMRLNEFDKKTMMSIKKKVRLYINTDNSFVIDMLEKDLELTSQDIANEYDRRRTSDDDEGGD